jgi:hypothetical protein
VGALTLSTRLTHCHHVHPAVAYRSLALVQPAAPETRSAVLNERARTALHDVTRHPPPHHSLQARSAGSRTAMELASLVRQSDTARAHVEV